ncbi:MAG: hypothetical protein HWD59_12340 [Coxiellaceae bacterium]|nr:MAG: hypothetical protein HWD59_12340 [Coxiellaceae bacterium]
MSTGTGAFEGNKLVINDGNSMFNETRTFEVKDKELIMTAKGKAKWEGKETAYDQTTVYKRK